MPVFSSARLVSRWVRLWLLGALATGCATTRLPQRPAMEAGYCDPPQLYRYPTASLPLPSSSAALADSALVARYPRRALLVANAAGALPGLQALVRLEATARRTPTADHRLAVATQRAQVLAQVQLLMAAVASVAAELDCEGERADQVAGYLAGQDTRRVQRFTLLSIGTGALSGIGTTVFEAKGTQYAFGIGGGLLTAALGLLALQTNHEVVFAHPRNLLADVWRETPSSALYPPGVWYALTNPAFSNRGETSVAHNTRQRWQHYGQLAAPNSPKGQKLQALLFGAGGSYGADELQIRANMLNELQAAVRLIDQDVQGLLLALTQQ